ncbi:hypothetical protein ACPEEZ_14785 [Frigoribacterium sp. 2-23]|uniref:hypothetical protein n=1 Tax=Frigoribacterium sp. 2-23 TaxID=3415006 RepID=UPI003C6EF3B7
MSIEFRSIDDGLEAVVTGAWTVDDEYEFRRSGAAALNLNYTFGFKERSLDFIRGLPVKKLRVMSRTTRDLSPIYSLAEHLTSLSVTSDPRTPIDLTYFGKLKSLSAYWPQVAASISAATNVEDAYFGSYTDESLVALRSMTSLRWLMLKDRPRLRSLEGLSDLPHLNFLLIAGASSLSDVSELRRADAPRLRSLSLPGCKRIETLDDIVHQTLLTRLDLGDCGPLTTLSPLRALTELRELFLDESTLIVDGDLQPIVDLPHMQVLGMMSRRHYKPSLKRVQSSMARG